MTRQAPLSVKRSQVILENAGTVIRTYGGVVLNKESPIRLLITKRLSTPTKKR
ncbi:hypothetical protein KCP71_12370 [Salmonella enterica subsp. enterica]|nr:hypothetical protein KCP71_12370 [Salmonella enterica subsp. enterica]